MAPFRFGLVESGSTPAEDWPDLVRRTEAAGYATIQVADHASLPVPPPMPALAAASRISERLRLGTLVLDASLADPVVLAREAGWLARVSGGRFELGLGAGWLAADHEVLGRPMPPPADRVRRLEETLCSLRDRWAADADADADHAAPPVLVGGGGRRVLELAAEHAAIVSIAPDMRSGRIGSASARTATLPAVTERAARVRARAGDRPLELHTTLTAVLGDDRDRAERTARAFDVPVDRVHEVPGVLVGPAGAMADQLRALRAATGISYVSVPAPHLDDVAPVVAALSGT